MFTVICCMFGGIGFGYYSLSSIFITEYKGTELGTIALLSNIVREMITLLLSPLLVKVAGPLAPIAAGGVLDGHYLADYHGFIRQAIRSSFIVPRLRPGVFHTFHRDFLVHAVESGRKIH